MKYNSIPLYYILNCLFIWNFIYSQECNLFLKGIVTDFHDDSFLIGALVKIEGTNFFSQTNLNGEFKIQGICAGRYILNFSHPNCKSKTKKINLKENKTFDLKLEHHINELEEIIVSDSRLSRTRKSVQEVLVDISEINISKNLEYNTPNVYLNLNKDNLSAREITELIDFIQKF